MSIVRWIRDALGIRLDRAQKKKTELEIEKLKSEKQEKLIKPVEQKDVEKYDPKTKELRSKVERGERKRVFAIDSIVLGLVLGYLFGSLLPEKPLVPPDVTLWLLIVLFLLLLTIMWVKGKRRG